MTILNDHVDYIVSNRFKQWEKCFKFKQLSLTFKRHLRDLDILEYEKDEEEYWNNRKIVSKNIVENDEE